MELGEDVDIPIEEFELKKSPQGVTELYFKGKCVNRNTNDSSLLLKPSTFHHLWYWVLLRHQVISLLEYDGNIPDKSYYVLRTLGSGLQQRFYLTEAYSMGTIENFHNLVIENHIQDSKESYKRSLIKQCERRSRTSASQMVALIEHGDVDINEVLEYHCGTSHWYLFSLIDIAAYFWNIKALRILLRLGANGGGARSLGCLRVKCQSKIPTPLWHLFDTEIILDNFWHRAEWNVSRNYAPASVFDWNNIHPEEAFHDETTRRNDFAIDGDDDDNDDNDVFSISDDPNVEALLCHRGDTIHRSFPSLRRICNAFGEITELLLECKPDFRDLYEVHGKMTHLHPMDKLLRLTKNTLKKHTVYRRREVPEEISVFPPPRRSQFADCLEGLGKAFDLLIRADPELQTVDIFQPPSTKTGLDRLLELVDWETIKRSK
ncbi:hypothetical protein F5Y16DRAFT_401271 [Xylariaceae sp. FL0255]|nr:hypothetical protein F5Y16DRAFT_401271 [Xylariaceae sp. FL0255]